MGFRVSGTLLGGHRLVRLHPVCARAHRDGGIWRDPALTSLRHERGIPRPVAVQGAGDVASLAVVLADFRNSLTASEYWAGCENLNM